MNQNQDWQKHNTLGGCAHSVPVTPEDEEIRRRVFSVRQDQKAYDADMRDALIINRKVKHA